MPQIFKCLRRETPGKIHLNFSLMGIKCMYTSCWLWISWPRYCMVGSGTVRIGVQLGNLSLTEFLAKSMHRSWWDVIFDSHHFNPFYGMQHDMPQFHSRPVSVTSLGHLKTCSHLIKPWIGTRLSTSHFASQWKSDLCYFNLWIKIYRIMGSLALI